LNIIVAKNVKRLAFLPVWHFNGFRLSAKVSAWPKIVKLLLLLLNLMHIYIVALILSLLNFSGSLFSSKAVELIH